MFHLNTMAPQYLIRNRLSIAPSLNTYSPERQLSTTTKSSAAYSSYHNDRRPLRLDKHAIEATSKASQY